MSETLSDRLDAVERALTDGETDLTSVRERAALSAEVERLDARLDELEAQLEELDAAVEAVRGYAGNVRAVNRDVERRASAALAKAEALEAALDVPEDESGETRSQRFDADRDGELSRGSAPRRADEHRDSEPRTPTVSAGSTAPTSADIADDGRSGGDGAGDSGTEQFIERVRDAL
jgi:chromosome segregation ATPase